MWGAVVHPMYTHSTCAHVDAFDALFLFPPLFPCFPVSLSVSLSLCLSVSLLIRSSLSRSSSLPTPTHPHPPQPTPPTTTHRNPQADIYSVMIAPEEGTTTLGHIAVHAGRPVWDVMFERGRSQVREEEKKKQREAEKKQRRIRNKEKKIQRKEETKRRRDDDTKR